MGLFNRERLRQWAKAGVPELVRRWFHRKTLQKDTLYAFYDLAMSPPSYDFSTFIACAGYFRQKWGCRWLHAVIVPGPDQGFKKAVSKELNEQGVENLKWRLRNIVVPCAWLSPNCRGVTVCSTRQEAEAIRQTLAHHVYPKRYTVARPRKRSFAAVHLVWALSRGETTPSLEATAMGLYYVRKWIQQKAGNRKVVTISLRESSYRPLRNSRLGEWVRFARSLDISGYCPVFIRDTERAWGPAASELEGLSVFHEAAWNLEIRAALYELSYLNLLVNNGPIGLCIYNRKVRYLIFKMITENPPGASSESYRSSSEEYFRKRVGISAGDQWPSATPFQRFVWEEDSLETIQKEFQEMCDRIERVEYAVGSQTTQAGR